jgi:hypothetical protein
VIDLPFAPVPVDPGTVKDPPREPQPLVAAYTSLIELGLGSSMRNLQRAIGPSQIGHPCDRHLVYLLDGTPTVNFSDPMKLLAGIGIHGALAEVFRRLDSGHGRFLVEEYVNYRGCEGTCDLLDQYLHVLVDWKTTSKARMAKYIKDGPPDQYRVQVQVYAAGLRSVGFQVDQIALIFLPHDGALAQTWAWTTEPDQSIADAAIERLAALRTREPPTTPASPDRYCGYCDHYNPRAADLQLGCPGPKGAKR